MCGCVPWFHRFHLVFINEHVFPHHNAEWEGSQWLDGVTSEGLLGRDCADHLARKECFVV